MNFKIILTYYTREWYNLYMLMHTYALANNKKLGDFFMKKILVLVLGIAIIIGSFVGCGSDSVNSNNLEESGSSGKKLIVGTMANALGLPVRQAEKAGYFKDAGLDVEIMLFATGAPINEAMAANQLDVAVSGMASVYALATGRYTYVGDGCITVGGQAMYARQDDEFAKTPGNIKGLFGEKEALKGADVLGPLATTAHYQSIKYMESFGLTSDDFNMVSMDYAQAYQAFITGKGDLIATIPPYSNQLEENGYIRVSDVSIVMGSPIVDTIYTQNDVANDRREEVKLFLEAYYRASEDLVNDEELRSQLALEWYAEEGKTYSDSDMQIEIEQQTYHTLDTLLTDEYKFGLTMTSIGEFFTNQDMIEKENLPNIKASLDSSFIEEIKSNK